MAPVGPNGTYRTDDDEEIMHSMCDVNSPCSPECAGRRRPGMPDRLVAALGISGSDWDHLGPQAQRIIVEILPAFVERFVQKSLHYGPGNANVLGPAGQFADIWRKIGPLRRALWDGEELTQESPREICVDLIGHALLTIDMLMQGVGRRGSQ
jgi:hypothetical protein